MKIAVIIESSTKQQVDPVMEALSCFPEHEYYNVGMKNEDGETPLTFLHTAMIAGTLINTNAVDFIIGGCGTGQGFFNGVLAFPNILCGLITDPLEAWLFMTVNAGNCISLPLNKGWGLGAKEGLKITFENLFRAPYGGGYPPERAELINGMHKKLRSQSNSYRKAFIDIIPYMDKEILHPALLSKGVYDLLIAAPESEEKKAVLQIYKDSLSRT